MACAKNVPEEHDAVSEMEVGPHHELEIMVQAFTNVIIEKGTTLLKTESYVVCAQPYPVRRTLFEEKNVWCSGKLSPEKMDEVDEAIYIGLCMDQQNIE